MHYLWGSSLEKASLEIWIKAGELSAFEEIIHTYSGLLDVLRRESNKMSQAKAV